MDGIVYICIIAAFAAMTIHETKEYIRWSRREKEKRKKEKEEEDVTKED